MAPPDSRRAVVADNTGRLSRELGLLGHALEMEDWLGVADWAWRIKNRAGLIRKEATELYKHSPRK